MYMHTRFYNSAGSALERVRRHGVSVAFGIGIVAVSSLAKDPRLDTIKHILIYQGGTSFDVVANWLLVSIYMVFLFLLHEAPPVPKLACVSFWWGFQIGLCIIEGCVGISVVWCACWGYCTWWRFRRSEFGRDNDVSSHTIAAKRLTEACGFKKMEQARQSTQLVLDVFSCVLAVYYADTAVPITSVAHFLALILGALCCGIQIRCMYGTRCMCCKNQSSSRAEHIAECNRDQGAGGVESLLAGRHSSAEEVVTAR
jgi:hypothetical protein